MRPAGSGDEDLRPAPYAERRRRLEQSLAGGSTGLRLTPATTDAAEAQRWLHARPREGIDGVVAKDPYAPYLPGSRRAMVKVKLEHTADCVVAGFRLLDDPRGAGSPAVSSLLLGLYGGDGLLRHVGVVTSFPAKRRVELLAELRPYVTTLAGQPWERGFGLEGGAVGRLKGSAGRWTPDLTQDWVPLRPELVCEAAYDHVEGLRWRHPARFVRWRRDREPQSCSIGQLTDA